MRPTLLLPVAVVGLTAALVAGCSDPPAANGPATGGSAPPAAAVEVDPAQLDTGKYPIEPLPALGTAETVDGGKRAEAHRMAPYIVGPWQVDDALVKGTPPVSLLVSREDVGFFLGPMLAAGLYRAPTVAGFASMRESTDGAIVLRNGAILMADPAAATAGVAEIVAFSLSLPVNRESSPAIIEPIREIPVPGRPDSHALVQVYSDGAAVVNTVTTVTAHGPYILAQITRSPDGPDAAAAMAARTLDLQIPLIDELPPADPGQLSALPLDPTGLVARTLPLPPEEATPLSGAAYPPAGALHGEDDPLAAAKRWDEAGVDEVSLGLTTLYQARDADAAVTLLQQMADDADSRPTTQPAAAVPGMPESRCARVSDATGLVPKYMCLAAVDRYVLEATSRDAVRTQQQLAAQYRMLTG